MASTSILVAYASKYGATRGIAERIAQTLVAGGLQAEAIPVKAVRDLGGYDAVIIGSAAYMGSWLKEATTFVEANQAALASKPLWLFSSGPLGTARTDARGQDVLVASEPKEFSVFRESLAPRGTQVFFGALDLSRLGFAHRLITKMPAAKTANLFPEGDFRDWQAIEGWAAAIALELLSVPVTSG